MFGKRDMLDNRKMRGRGYRLGLFAMLDRRCNIAVGAKARILTRLALGQCSRVDRNTIGAVISAAAIMAWRLPDETEAISPDR
jgi:hypothetical protein